MSDLAEVYQRILEYFNSVDDPERISKDIPDDPEHGRASARAYGIRIDVARRILEKRDSMGGRFEKVEEIFEVKGIGPDTTHDILVRFAQDDDDKRPSGMFPAQPEPAEDPTPGPADEPAPPIDQRGTDKLTLSHHSGDGGGSAAPTGDGSGWSRMWDIAEKLLPVAALLVGVFVGLKMNQREETPVRVNLTLPDSVRLNLDEVQLKLDPVELDWPQTITVAAAPDSGRTEALFRAWLDAIVRRDSVLTQRDTLLLNLASLLIDRPGDGPPESGLQQTARLNHHVDIKVERDLTGREVITSICTMEDVPVAHGTVAQGRQE